MGRDKENKILYEMDIVRGRREPAEVERQILACALLDGEKVRIQLLKDPGQAGKFQAHYMAGQLQGYTVKIEAEIESKENRADPFAAQCTNGFLKLIEGTWNHAFVNELCCFPNAAHDDQVDAASAAFRALVRRRHFFDGRSTIWLARIIVHGTSPSGSRGGACRRAASISCDCDSHTLQRKQLSR